MSDQERGAYTPPTDAPLSFDARQPVRGARPIPFTLIISILVLLGLAAAIFVFYRSGVRHAGQGPETVGAPVGGIKAPPPEEAQPQDPAAGLQIYKAEGGKAAPAAAPRFTAPPEQPQARSEPPAPKIAVTPIAPAAPALRPTIVQPSVSADPPASAEPPKTIPKPASPPKAAPMKAAPAPAPVAKAAAAKPESKLGPNTAAAPLAAKPPSAKDTAAKDTVAKDTGVAAVQIGAFSSRALADTGWNEAAAVAPGAAAGKGKNVEKIDKDGRTLFRTQLTGFASRADATAFCNKLKAAGKACFVK